MLLGEFVPGGWIGKQKVQDIWNNQNWILDGILCAKEQVFGKGSAAPSPSLYPHPSPRVPKVFPVLPSQFPFVFQSMKINFILPSHLLSFTCLCVAFQSPSICRDIHLTPVLGAWAHILNFFCFLYFWHQKEFHGRVQIAETNNLFCFERLFQSSLVGFFLKKKKNNPPCCREFGAKKRDSPLQQECPQNHMVIFDCS